MVVPKTWGAGGGVRGAGCGGLGAGCGLRDQQKTYKINKIVIMQLNCKLKKKMAKYF